MTVSETAWADNGGFRPNPGQFPIQVERHLNAYVSRHVPGVTTVTAGARYYSLHGLVAYVADQEGLDEAATVDLLRRCEVLLAYVTHRHSKQPGHVASTPSGHGVDAILRKSSGSDVSIGDCAAEGTYSQAKWGFSGAYRGSELTLKILDQSGFFPGPWHDAKATGGALNALVEMALNNETLTDSDADELSSHCLCRMASATDGPWFAKLLAGQPGTLGSSPSLGGLLWQLGRLTTVAVTRKPVRNASELGEILMFDHDTASDTSLQGMVAPARWRGALLRAESVWAWRLLWRRINELVGGARPVAELTAAFADLLPSTSVNAFRAALPATVDAQARPLAAERQVASLATDEERWLAILMLGARRQHELTDEERMGFASRNELHGGQWEELTPGWTASVLDRFDSRSVRDLGRELASILVNRSQRVALRKANFSRSTMRFNYPARLHVRDGVAVTIFGETAPAPATRLPQYLSIARQSGLFAADSGGFLQAGPNGGHLA